MRNPLSFLVGLGAVSVIAGAGGAAAAGPPPVAPVPAVAAATPASAAARADEDRPIADPPSTPSPAAVLRAKEVYNQGAQLWQKGDLAGALRAFRASYEQDGGVEALANMAVVEKDLGRPRAAAEHLDAAISKLPESKAGLVADLKQRLAAICQEIAILKLVVTATQGEVYVDDRWVAAAPFERTVYVDPGDRKVSVQASGTTLRQSVRAKKGATEVVTVSEAEVKAAVLAAAPASPSFLGTPAAAPVAAGDGTVNRPFWIAGGIGVGLLATGLVGLGVYVRGHDERTKIDADIRGIGGFCGPKPAPGFKDDCHARDQEASNETVGAVIGLVGGAGLGSLALAGLMVWLVPPSPAVASPQVQVLAGPGSVTLRGRF